MVARSLRLEVGGMGFYLKPNAVILDYLHDINQLTI